jgi:predicted RNA-binding protein with PUA-like domain
MAKTQYWLIKSEPSVYPFEQLEEDRETVWTGVRSFEGRNNIRAMKPGDLCLFYHSTRGRAVVGVARVRTKPEADPTAPDEDWASVEMDYWATFHKPVELSTVKKTAALKDFPLLTRSRLSVAPVSEEHFQLLLKMGKTELPKRRPRTGR